MALKLSTIIPGLPVLDPNAYWRITELLIARPTEHGALPKMNVAVETYFSETERQNGDEPIIPRTLYPSVELTDEEANDIVSIIYNALKRTEAFAGAVDI